VLSGTQARNGKKNTCGGSSLRQTQTWEKKVLRGEERDLEKKTKEFNIKQATKERNSFPVGEESWGRTQSKLFGDTVTCRKKKNEKNLLEKGKKERPFRIHGKRGETRITRSVKSCGGGTRRNKKGCR